jgi:hypothetical protein
MPVAMPDEISPVGSSPSGNPAKLQAPAAVQASCGGEKTRVGLLA